MITAKLLIEEDNQQDFRTFYFNENAIDGIYIMDSEFMGVIINGSEFILQFNNAIFEEIKTILKIKTLGFN